MESCKEKTTKDVRSAQTEPASVRSIAAPIQWPAITPRLFDSSSGLTHYFVRPNDDFVLNSLEILDADAYLYRLLKHEKYDSIAWIEIESTDCRIYTYDAQSEAIFKGSAPAEKKGPQGMMGTKVRRPPAEMAPTPRFGRRRIRTFSRGEEFMKQFAAEIGQALRNPKQKTAIVMPIAIFGKNGYCGEPVIDTLNDIEKRGNYGNILLLTMPRREELSECFEANRPRLHSSWASNVLNLSRTGNVDIIQESILQLRAQGLIVLSDEHQPDEIGNLLLRKKLIEKNPAFTSLPATKIYALAELLHAHCMQVSNEFQTIPFIRRNEHCIRQLNGLLDIAEVQEEIAARVEKLAPVRTGYTNRIHALYLERVYHQNVIRYENRSAEAEILKEFASFGGAEMQGIQESILSAIRQFEDGQAHLRAEEAAGRTVSPDDLTYMNFRFVGPPGTGKTTVAGLTARYLNARGILPTSRIIAVNAAQMIRSEVGGTARLLREAADRADGGVLIIDEFQSFESAYQGGNVAQDAMRAIVQIVNEKRSSLCIIAAGYEEDVARVFRFDDGAARRFPRTIRFQNYSVASLLEILAAIAGKRGRKIDPEALPLIRQVIESDMAVLGDSFGNVGYLKDVLVARLTESLLRRADGQNTFTAEDVFSAFPEKRRQLLRSQKTIDDALQEFDSYVGAEMESVKREIITAVDTFDYLRQRANAAASSGKTHKFPYMNMRFAGPPGTGKTSIAHMTAKYMNARGFLPRDTVEVVNATELVSGTVGQTAEKLREAARRANGGVLIIDEFHGFENAYQGGNIAKDAIEAITAIINKYGDTLCIIAAGYEEGIQQVLSYDAGSDRRFPYTIHFPSYSVPTLLTIFDSILDGNLMQITPEARALLGNVIRYDQAQKGDSFGNAGYLHDELFPKLVRQMVARKTPDGAADHVIHRSDIISAFPQAGMDPPEAEPTAVSRR